MWSNDWLFLQVGAKILWGTKELDTAESNLLGSEPIVTTAQIPLTILYFIHHLSTPKHNHEQILLLDSQEIHALSTSSPATILVRATTVPV